MALAEGALGRLAHRGEGFWQERVERFAIRDARLECQRTCAQALVVERCNLRFQGVDRRDRLAEAFDDPIVGAAENAPGYTTEHRKPRILAALRQDSDAAPMEHSPAAAASETAARQKM